MWGRSAPPPPSQLFLANNDTILVDFQIFVSLLGQKKSMKGLWSPVSLLQASKVEKLGILINRLGILLTNKNFSQILNDHMFFFCVCRYETSFWHTYIYLRTFKEWKNLLKMWNLKGGRVHTKHIYCLYPQDQKKNQDWKN